MTGFDYAVFTVVMLSLLVGFWRGVVSELLALAAWVVAFIAARNWSGIAASMLTEYIADATMRQLAGFAAVLVTTLLLFSVARFVITHLLRAVGLGLVDRFFGALFGIARGALVVLVGVLVAGLTDFPRQTWWRNAWLAPPLETVVLAGKPWLPVSLAQRIRYR